MVKDQLGHSSKVENLKFKNDEILKFKSIPTTADYAKYLSQIDPGKTKAKIGTKNKNIKKLKRGTKLVRNKKGISNERKINFKDDKYPRANSKINKTQINDQKAKLTKNSNNQELPKKSDQHLPSNITGNSIKPQRNYNWSADNVNQKIKNVSNISQPQVKNTVRRQQISNINQQP